jgi:hypothetical protein
MSKRLAALLLLALAGCDGGAQDAPAQQTKTPSPTKILLIGIDGASFDVIDPLLAQGKLPTFEKIIRAGVRSKLASQKPILSPCVWTTIATGRNRADHGIVGFVSRHSPPGEAQLVATTDRTVPALWSMASAMGRSVGVVGWWVSWPSETVDGFVVSDRVAQGRWESWTDGRKDTGATYPPELFAQIADLVVDPVKSPPMAELGALADFSADELAEIAAADHPIPFNGPSVLKFGFCEQRTYENIAFDLLPRKQPDLAMVFLVAVDPVSHTFWHCYQPDKFPQGVDPDLARRLGRLVPSMYEHDDATVAKLLRDGRSRDGRDRRVRSRLPGLGQPAGPDAVGRLQERRLRKVEELDEPVNVGTSGIHQIDGVFLACGGPIVRGAVPKTQPSVLDVAPTVLALLGLPIAENMPGRVLEELIDPGFLKAHPIRRIPAYEDVVKASPGARPDASAADRARADQLRSIGYVDVDRGDAKPDVPPDGKKR